MVFATSTPFADVLAAGSTHEQGDPARLSTFVGAVAVGDMLKTTLGPKGLDKLLPSSRKKDFSITNDGATIMQSLQLDNPAAKVLVSVSKGQDDAVGDGTTSVAVLAAELLRQAERLIDQDRLHPQMVIQGFRVASAVALKALQAFADARPLAYQPGHQIREELVLKIARTTLSSKVVSAHHEHFAQMAVQCIKSLIGSSSELSSSSTLPSIIDIDLVQYVKRTGGSLADSYVVEDGFILPKPAGVGVVTGTVVEDARVLVANTHMDADKVKVFGAKVRADSTAQVADVERAEREKMRRKVEAIVRTGCTVFVNRQLVYNWPEQLLADAGVLCIEHADFEGVERVAAACCARIVSTFPGAFSEEQSLKDKERSQDMDDKLTAYLGHCKRVQVVDVFGEPMVHFSGLSEGAKAATIVLRGATGVLLDEAERALHDALRVISSLLVKGDGRTVLGGGHAELLMAAAIDRFLTTESASAVPGSSLLSSNYPASESTSSATHATNARGLGKMALAVEAFARALRALPTAIADNAGLDATDVVNRLRLAHAQALALTSSPSPLGLKISGSSGGTMDGDRADAIGDIDALGIVESFQMKRQVVVAAGEAAEMLLRVDYIFREPPKPRDRDDHCH